jgi:hypothetical protein
MATSSRWTGRERRTLVGHPGLSEMCRSEIVASPGQNSRVTLETGHRPSDVDELMRSAWAIRREARDLHATANLPASVEQCSERMAKLT